jgi:tRNA(adenine34) deaminase
MTFSISPYLASKLMGEALHEAMIAEAQGEVPIGAVLATQRGDIVARSINSVTTSGNPLAHAEVKVIEHFSSTHRSTRYEQCILCVTVEPCIMCAGAILLARIPIVIWGTEEPITGAFGSKLDLCTLIHEEPNGIYRPVRSIGGIRREEAKLLMQNFFRKRRA